MIESIKNRLWDMLKEKKVSLAMFYDRDGKILWHRGREIIGKNINDGEGFCKSYVLDSLQSGAGINKENVTVMSTTENLSESAHRLLVRSIVIQPIAQEYFLYIDSGTKEYFTEVERESLRILGELLGDTIQQIIRNEKDTGGITGNSEKIEKIRELALKYSMEEDPVLILGETGVGKSHVAELIHRFSGRPGKFIVINTPSVSEQLFESVMFGHKKGAFTDAKFDKKGAVTEAEGGTLFIDEISEIPAALQAKLLRFIETKKFQVLGESLERNADVRILAATNRELQSAIEKGEFREDLYYRLQVLELRIPPLRERKDDITGLAKEMMIYLNGKELGEGFWEAMLDHAWPGNVRELITVMKRAGIELDAPINGDHIREIIDHSSYKKVLHNNKNKIETILSDLKKGRSFWTVVRKPFMERDLCRDEVKGILRQILYRSGGTFRDILPDLNIKSEDYKKFLNFINDNKLKP